MKLKAAFLDFATLGPAIDTAPLEQHVEVSYYPVTPPAEIGARLAGCAVAIVNKARLSAEMITAARELKLIVLAATGTDNVDIECALRRGIAVANIRDYCTPSVVQHVLALILALTQQCTRYDALVRGGAWSRSDTFALFDYPFRELAGRALGIVGYGNLGRGVARAAECLGLRVLIAARPGAATEPGDGRVPFAQMLAEADIVSLHCPLTPATRHLIGRQELSRMKREALLINTARGALIDSAALLAALGEGVIGGSAARGGATEPDLDAAHCLGRSGVAPAGRRASRREHRELLGWRHPATCGLGADSVPVARGTHSDPDDLPRGHLDHSVTTRCGH